MTMKMMMNIHAKTSDIIMNMQDIYDNLTPAERNAFASNNADRIRDTLIEDFGVNLSCYSKEELLEELRGRDLYEIIDGALDAGVTMVDIRNWLEREIRD